MSTSTSSNQDDANTLSLQQQHQVETVTSSLGNTLARALIFFSFAWLVLTVGAYTFYPLSPVGIASLVIGIILLIISLINFVRYGLDSRKARKQLRDI